MENDYCIPYHVHMKEDILKPWQVIRVAVKQLFESHSHTEQQCPSNNFHKVSQSERSRSMRGKGRKRKLLKDNAEVFGISLEEGSRVRADSMQWSEVGCSFCRRLISYICSWLKLIIIKVYFVELEVVIFLFPLLPSNCPVVWCLYFWTSGSTNQQNCLDNQRCLEYFFSLVF